ncbi:hypothetical protein [Domibacillus enclensis]|uniref:Uncharacterized protein n=1 Tax=Domibacillus enclensis TaxID=1017273 RepID=A0A1N7C4H6_9BACI|nr:hypothetical protein [Domibacillus enclensis]OXS74236.1 hypothetical protein B1B05_17340 [Domibacillus enclensis]SIR58489.1 hypothetical protein SAMN05443094_11165 [Domibacillus enclensis]
MNTDKYDYHVARYSSNIMSFVKKIDRDFTTEEIVTRVLEIPKIQSDYQSYFKATTLFFRANKDFKKRQGDCWSYKGKNVVAPAADSPVKTFPHRISYSERVKGYLTISTEFINKINSAYQNSGKTDVTYDGFTYEFQWIVREKTAFFFGNGVMDFFADSEMAPGQIVTCSTVNDAVSIVSSNDGTVTRFNPKAADISEIKKLCGKEEARSAFILLYELLAVYSDGLDIDEIEKHISKYKSISVHSLKNLLKQNECFEYDIAAGTWIVKVEKISRYYKNEMRGNAETQLSYNWLIDNEAPNERNIEPAEKQKETQSSATLDTGQEQVTRDTLIDTVVKSITENTVKPLHMKEEVNALVTRCFTEGELDLLEAHNQTSLELYSYFLEVEAFLIKWKEEV